MFIGFDLEAKIEFFNNSKHSFSAIYAEFKPHPFKCLD